MPEYTQAELSSQVTALINKTYTDAKFLILANMAMRAVIGQIDLRGTKRRTALSPNLFDDIYQYTCPSDLKGTKLIDINPQLSRSRLDYWNLTTEEEFHRRKGEGRVDSFGDPIEFNHSENWLGNSLVAISERDFIKKLLISRPIDDNEVAIDALNAVGDWTGYGDGENVTKDADDYVKGSAALNWDINADGGTTAGIVNASLTEFDISDFLSTGSIFVWAYLSSKTDVTNFIIRVGSGAGAYYSITITTGNDGNAFVDGWNLLRFDLTNKSTTGTPDDDACDYIALFMTKDAGKTSETDFRFDNLILKRGEHHNLHYYSKYGWQTAAGTYIENATETTDILNLDTDEVELLELKAAELIERHLKNHKEANMYLELYKLAKTEYVFNNPSEALLNTQTYFDL